MNKDLLRAFGQWVTISALTILTPFAVIGAVEVRNRNLCGEVCRPFIVHEEDVERLRAFMEAVAAQRAAVDKLPTALTTTEKRLQQGFKSGG